MCPLYDQGWMLMLVMKMTFRIVNARDQHDVVSKCSITVDMGVANADSQEE